ncbi:branched-chain amino acid ABC transporter permease [Heliobacillus mobilis]|uniref:Branched-chain amino acid ABC transporter permease n=2 Tax=Heliobacterium mobile TaxID=28064 RepID=A0A6I3SM39_HELMO|nr:branched-chain amino acid ABC transporter permease [Heliobacterium mobile]
MSKSLLTSILRRIDEKEKSLYLLLLIAVAILPLASQSDYVLRIATLCGIYIVLALGLNLVTGYAGQMCLGWAAFYGIGAYTSALLVMRLHASFWLALPAAGLMAAFFGLLLGIPTMRLKNTYLAITTLGFGEIVRLILLNWTDLTRGSMGLPGIPSPSFFGIDLDGKLFYYYFIVVLVIVTLVTMARLVDSRLGRALQAIREDELAAKSMGIDTTRYKIVAFAIGAFFAGIAGSFFAHYSAYIDPHNFAFGESIAVLSMVILGGMRSLPGVVFGAVVLTLLPEVLREAAEYRMIVFGGILMLTMLLRPQGIFGGVQRKKVSLTPEAVGQGKQPLYQNRLPEKAG